MREGGWTLLTAGAVALTIGVGMLINDAVDARRMRIHAAALTGGDPEAGHEALARRPCGGCHLIPGVRNATGQVGPSLAGWSSRVYIEGRVQNTPDDLVAWIVDPHAMDPQTAMPATGVRAQEARDIAAYLYTLD